MNELLTTPVPQARPETGEKSPSDCKNGNGKGNGNGESTDVHEDPKAEVVYEDIAAIESANIFITQQDTRDFIMITAKHLADDDQPLSTRIKKQLETDGVVTIDSGSDIPNLTERVYHSLLKVCPELTKAKCATVVAGIVYQFKEVIKLDRRLGPNFIETFDRERRLKDEAK